MSNILDLRKKIEPEIRIILQKRVWWAESLKMLSIIAITTTVVWGISKADDIVQSISPAVKLESFSAVGIVSDMATTTFSMINVESSDKSGNTTYTFNLSDINKIQTKYSTPLTLSDIKVGDKIVVQGTEGDGIIKIKRIFSFSKSIPEQVGVMSAAEPSLEIASSTLAILNTASTTLSVSTSTATSTLSIDTATTTNENISTSTTSTATTTASTTPSLTETISNIIASTTDSLTQGSSTIASSTPSLETQTVQATTTSTSTTQTVTPPADSASTTSTTTTP